MVSAIVLAAGLAKRAGAAKFIWPIGKVPAIRKLVLEILKTDVQEVLVVTGFWKNEAMDALKGLNVKFIHNENFEKGQSESLKVAVQNVANSSIALMFFLADQPFITSHIISKMIKYYNNSSVKIIVPSFNGQWKNPVLLDKKSWTTEILKLEGDIGAREIINHNLEEVVFLPFDNDNLFFEDFDTKEEYKELVLKYVNYNARCR